MGFWYSKNAKLMLRSETKTWYRTTNAYYGYIHNGEAFKATDGTTGMYAFTGTYYSNSSTASTEIQSRRGNFIIVPDSTTNLHVCLDNNDWDDMRYNYTGEVSGITKAISLSFPGSTIVTLTNSTNLSVTFNALVWTTTVFYLSDSATSQGTSKEMLRCSYIFDSPITLEAGQTYTLSLTT